MKRTKRDTAASYTRDGEWGGYTIRAAATGWIITTWSRRTGEWTDSKYLLPYGTLGMSHSTDLAAPWNAIYTNGETLRDALTHDAGSQPVARTLRKGHRVQ